MNEQTHFFIKIYLSHFIRKGWCWLCVRGELETETDCHILTQSSSRDHSSTSFAFWLGCSTVGHWWPKALCLPLALTLASCPRLQLRLELTDWPKPSVVPGYIIVQRPPASCGRTHTEFNHVHRSRWYSDIFDRMHLFRCSSAYLHRCISLLTARSRVNMLQQFLIETLLYFWDFTIKNRYFLPYKLQ